MTESGPRALEVYGRLPGASDVVLMDTWMPHMDGLMFLLKPWRTLDLPAALHDVREDREREGPR